MSPDMERRPGAEPEASQETVAAAVESTSTDAPEATPRPRCARCGHTLKVVRSVARAYGPKCWTRTALGQLDRRRDAIGRALASLARRVASSDASGLALVAAALDDAVDALDDRVVGS